MLSAPTSNTTESVLWSYNQQWWTSELKHIAIYSGFRKSVFPIKQRIPRSHSPTSLSRRPKESSKTQNISKYPMGIEPQHATAGNEFWRDSCCFRNSNWAEKPSTTENGGIMEHVFSQFIIKGLVCLEKTRICLWICFKSHGFYSKET